MDRDIELFIGFITYRGLTAKYLPFFLDSLKKQTYQNFKIVILDNSETESNENSSFIKQNYPEIDFTWRGENMGFARGFNLLIDKSIKAGAKYFLALNPDMIFEPEMAEELIRSAEKYKNIGAVQPKILRWDFANGQKTKIIDSYGLTITKDFCFFDKMQGAEDLVICANQRIFGFTGAAVLFKLEALADIAFNNKSMMEYFDGLMFMYKEDCDLSIRLRLAGWEIILASKAIAFHDRTASTKGHSIKEIIFNRKNKSKLVKKWSYFNHWIMIIKFWRLFPWKMKINIIWFQLKSLIFIILFEQYLIPELIKVLKLKKDIKIMRGNINSKISFHDLLKI